MEEETAPSSVASHMGNFMRIVKLTEYTADEVAAMTTDAANRDFLARRQGQVATKK